MAVLKPALKYGKIYSELQRGYFLWFSSDAIKITVFGVAWQQLILSSERTALPTNLCLIFDGVITVLYIVLCVFVHIKYPAAIERIKKKVHSRSLAL